MVNLWHGPAEPRRHARIVMFGQKLKLSILVLPLTLGVLWCNRTAHQNAKVNNDELDWQDLRLSDVHTLGSDALPTIVVFQDKQQLFDLRCQLASPVFKRFCKDQNLKLFTHRGYFYENVELQDALSDKLKAQYSEIPSDATFVPTATLFVPGAKRLLVMPHFFNENDVFHSYYAHDEGGIKDTLQWYK